MTLVAIRHAPPIAPGVCYGDSEVRVAPVDHDALPKLAADHVWTSDLPRCLSLARSLAVGMELHVRRELREIHFGEWEGRSWASIEAEDGVRLAAWMSNWKTAPPPGGESLPELTARIEAWWRSLDPSANHLWIAHAGPMRAVRVLGGISWDDAMAWKVPHLKAVELPTIHAIARG